MPGEGLQHGYRPTTGEGEDEMSVPLRDVPVGDSIEDRAFTLTETHWKVIPVHPSARAA